jgi:hypothetical protein
MVAMGILDKAKDALSQHSEHVDTTIEKAGDLLDERTGGKFVEHVDTGQDFASERIRGYADGEPESIPEQPV